MEDQKILTIESPPEHKSTIKDMAYQGWDASPVHGRMFRLERGFPYLRNGKPVVTVPQFKGLTVYSHTIANAPAPFQQTATNTAVAWPKIP